MLGLIFLLPVPTDYVTNLCYNGDQCCASMTVVGVSAHNGTRSYLSVLMMQYGGMDTVITLLAMADQALSVPITFL